MLDHHRFGGTEAFPYTDSLAEFVIGMRSAHLSTFRLLPAIREACSRQRR